METSIWPQVVGNWRDCVGVRYLNCACFKYVPRGRDFVTGPPREGRSLLEGGGTKEGTVCKREQPPFSCQGEIPKILLVSIFHGAYLCTILYE